MGIVLASTAAVLVVATLFSAFLLGREQHHPNRSPARISATRFNGRRLRDRYLDS